MLIAITAIYFITSLVAHLAKDVKVKMPMALISCVFLHVAVFVAYLSGPSWVAGYITCMVLNYWLAFVRAARK